MSSVASPPVPHQTEKEEIKKEEIDDIDEDMVITPWDVEGNIKYNKLIKEFGLKIISDDQLERFKRLTGKPLHIYLKRKIYFSHRGFNDMLDAFEAGRPIYLYTGRGATSESLHLGHILSFNFISYLQDALGAIVVIQMADDEKYYFQKSSQGPEKPFDYFYKLGFENAKDIVSLGFDREKTFVFSNNDYRKAVPEYEQFASDTMKRTTMNTIKAIFGLTESDSVAKFTWPFYQSVAAFSKAFPHIFKEEEALNIVVLGIDQDPYFRLARQLATKFNLLKPVTIESVFLPKLEGGGKASSTGKVDATIFLTDDEETIRTKIKKYSYSGSRGDGSLADHRRLGGGVENDMAYQYLRYFEENDEKVETVRTKFASGEMTCGEVKDILADVIVKLVKKHQENRAKMTDDELAYYYSFRDMNTKPKVPVDTSFKPSVVEKKIDDESSAGAGATYEDDEDFVENEKELYLFLSEFAKFKVLKHQPLLTMEDGNEIASKLDGTVCKNLFVKNKKNGYYMLVVLGMTEKLDFENLAAKYNYANSTTFTKNDFKFADENELKTHLKVVRGACSLLALFNNMEEHNVTVFVSCGIKKDSKVNFHPLRNDKTLTLDYSDMVKFMVKTGHSLVML